jgi:hypothetical protein
MIESVAIRSFLAASSGEEDAPATMSGEKEPRISESNSSRFYQAKQRKYGEKLVLWGRQ